MTNTLQTVAQAFILTLVNQGKGKITTRAYLADLQQPIAYFGADRPISSITLPMVGKFLKSEALNFKANGQPRSARSIDRSLRVFRMMLVYAMNQGLIQTLPLPKVVSRGYSLKESA